MKIRHLWVLIIAALIVIVTAQHLYAQTMTGGTATIGGHIFTGSQNPDGTPNTTTAAPLTGAKVMVQDMHTGAFVTYGTVTGNSWTATVPAPGEYVVMFSAPDHDATSRSFEVQDGDNLTKDAYLPPLPLPKANLLVYAFEDWAVNGEDDFPDDPPLAGVTFEVIDEGGNVVATGVSGASPTLPPGAGPHPDGLYYFTGLEPGKYHVRAIPPDLDGNPATSDWYHTTSEEGSQLWEVVLYPGDPGTQGGAYLIWFGFVKKLGQIPNAEVGSVPPDAGSISGVLLDADGNDPFDTLPPNLVCVSANSTVPDGFVVLFTDGGGGPPHPVATTEADPVTGEYQFVNVPPGRYKLFGSDIPIDYVWVPRQVAVSPNTAVTGQDIWMPRFYARARGYVRDSTGAPIAGARVKFRLKPHSVWKETTTDANGWFNFDDLEEVEVMGFVDVEPPPGYRLMNVDAPNDPDPCIAEKGKRGNRYVMFFSGMNYQVDLFVEAIPPGEGDIVGFTFNDHLMPGTWIPDGLYDEKEEGTIPGVTVELWDASMTTLITTTTSGVFDEEALKAQGWIPLYSQVPVDEFGDVYNGPILGYYEFRGLAPGTYNVKVIPPDGHLASTPTVVSVTVSGGDRHEVNFGLYTEVPKAGIIEGGIFDDLNLDTNPQSTFYMEKAIITGAPVVVYDHLGYQLDVMYQPSPLCYETAPPDLCDRPDLGDEVEIERRIAPGPHLFFGNDPNHPDHNPNYIPINMTYTFGQANAKFEADWSLPPIAFLGLGVPLQGNAQVLPDNAPVIDNVVPVGSYLITGRNFGDTQGHSTVTLAGQELRVISWSDTEIHVDDPPEPVSGPLVVTTAAGPSNAVHVEMDYSPERAHYMEERSVFVDASNTGLKDGSREHPWVTITEALNHLPEARPRYVFVAPGTYYEQIRITESDVYLIGAGPRETIIDGRSRVTITSQGPNGNGPVIYIGRDTGGEEEKDKDKDKKDKKDKDKKDKKGGIENVMISGFTIRGGTVKDGIGAGIFSDHNNRNININNCIIIRNGGYYGGGIWLHNSNHDVKIWSNLIAENGNYGGYGGGISVNDMPQNEENQTYGEPEHIGDDKESESPPGTYQIFNNLIFHNFSPDYGGGISLYEVKDRLQVFGNTIKENKADDHGGGIYFHDTGPIEVYGNVFLDNYCADDGGAISFEDVANEISTVEVYNNLFAKNVADDRGENHARGGALAFDDTFQVRIYHNTIVSNVVAGHYDPVGGAIDSERNGHEYTDRDPGFSDVQIENNIIWGNQRLLYDPPTDMAEDGYMDYTMGTNYRWSPDNLHVDNPSLQEEWESYKNSESLTLVRYNDIAADEYADREGNISVDPQFVDPEGLDWHLSAGSPVIDQAPVSSAPQDDLERLPRSPKQAMVDMGAYEFQWSHPGTITIVKAADPADGTDFSFTGDLGTFELDDADPDDEDDRTNTITFAGLSSGSYVIEEQDLPRHWRLATVECTSDLEGGGSFELVTDVNGDLIGVIVHLQADEHITCTFTNERERGGDDND